MEKQCLKTVVTSFSALDLAYIPFVWFTVPTTSAWIKTIVVVFVIKQVYCSRSKYINVKQQTRRQLWLFGVSIWPLMYLDHSWSFPFVCVTKPYLIIYQNIAISRDVLSASSRHYKLIAKVMATPSGIMLICERDDHRYRVTWSARQPYGFPRHNLTSNYYFRAMGHIP